jgi:hypothetical protein
LYPGNGNSHGGGQGGAAFNIYGTISALDSGSGTIEVDVESSDGLAGEAITVQTTGSTIFKDCVEDDRIGFGDLEKGDTVRIKGVVDGGTYYANVVILEPLNDPAD